MVKTGIMMKDPLLILVSLLLCLALRCLANPDMSPEQFDEMIKEKADPFEHLEAKMDKVRQMMKEASPGEKIESITNEQFNQGLMNFLMSEFGNRLIENQPKHTEDWQPFEKNFHSQLSSTLLHDCQQVTRKFSSIRRLYETKFFRARDQLSPRSLDWLDNLEVCHRIRKHNLYTDFLRRYKNVDAIKARLVSPTHIPMDPEQTHGLIEAAYELSLQNSSEPDEWLEGMAQVASEDNFDCSHTQLKQTNLLFEAHQSQSSLAHYLRHFGLARARECATSFLSEWEHIAQGLMLERERKFKPLRAAIRDESPALRNSRRNLLNSIDDKHIVSGLVTHLSFLGHDLKPKASEIEGAVDRFLGPLCKGIPDNRSLEFCELLKLLRSTSYTAVTNVLRHQKIPLDWLTNLFICGSYKSSDLDYEQAVEKIRSSSSSSTGSQSVNVAQDTRNEPQPQPASPARLVDPTQVTFTSLKAPSAVRARPSSLNANKPDIPAAKIRPQAPSVSLSEIDDDPVMALSARLAPLKIGTTPSSSSNVNKPKDSLATETENRPQPQSVSHAVVPSSTKAPSSSKTSKEAESQSSGPTKSEGLSEVVKGTKLGPRFLHRSKELIDIEAQLMSQDPSLEPQEALALLETAHELSKQWPEPDRWLEILLKLASGTDVDCSSSNLKDAARLRNAAHLVQVLRAYPRIVDYIKHFGAIQGSECTRQFLLQWNPVSGRLMPAREKQFLPLRWAIKWSSSDPSHREKYLISFIDDGLISLGLGARLRSLGKDLNSSPHEIKRLVDELLDPLCEGVPIDLGNSFVDLHQSLRSMMNPTDVTFPLGLQASPNWDWLANLYICTRYKSNNLDYSLIVARNA